MAWLSLGRLVQASPSTLGTVCYQGHKPLQGGAGPGRPVGEDGRLPGGLTLRCWKGVWFTQQVSSRRK